jgi:glycine/D-amino acid oxidase-like deaminating enzyme
VGIVWDIDVDRQDFPALDSNLEVDLVVVGLGGSGLTALLHGAQRGLNVIGIDSGRIAAGAGGRNGGLLLAGIAAFHHDARETFGREKAVRLYNHTLDEMDLIQTATPQAVRRNGALRIAHDEVELLDVMKHRDALLEDGFPVVDYDGPQGRGILITSDGTFQPAFRATLLAKLAVAAGARIFTNTPALKIESGTVQTPGGVIIAKNIVVAIDGNLGKVLPQVANYVKPVRLQMVSTEPESNLKLEHAVYTRDAWDYWQQLPDGRIAIGGGRDQAIELEYTDLAEPTKNIREYLAEQLRKIGSTSPIEHHWAAIVSYTENGLPLVTEALPGVWAIGGYCGTGNVVGALLGRAVIDACIDGSSEVVRDFSS